MGSGGAKTTNKMLEAQNQRSRGLQDLATDWSKESHGAGRGDIDWARGSLMDMYKNLGAEDGGGGGDGGGPAFPSWQGLNWEDPRSMSTLLDFMNTGGYSDTDKGNILSYGSAPITAMADQLRRGLNTQARGSGVGYASGLGKLYQDQAYAGSELAKGVAADLAEKIIGNKFRGAQAVTGIDTEKRGFNVSERDKAYQAAKEAQAAARARAGAGRAAAENEFGQRRALIHDILGLEGDKDLAYYDRALASGGQVYGGINSRQSETPLWQRASASMLPAAASAAVGAFTGGFKKKPNLGLVEDQLAG